MPGILSHEPKQLALRLHCTVLLPDLDADLGRLLECHPVAAVNPHAETLEDEP
ncbi:MAG: hypothetical protein ABWZ76_08035 [Acidimicrobiales bacterium]